MPQAVCVGFSRSCAATACAKRSRFLAILAVSAMLCERVTRARGAVRRASRRAHQRGDLGGEQLGRVHRALVGEHADADVAEEAVVAEQLVLGEDLLRAPPRACRRAGGRRGRSRRRTARGSSAASPARGRSGSSSASRGRRTRRAARWSAVGYVHVRVDPDGGARGVGLGAPDRLAVELDQRREAGRLPADDRDHQRQAERARRARSKPAVPPTAIHTGSGCCSGRG